MSLEFADLIAPLNVADFTAKHWGRKLYATCLGEEELGYLRENFCRGDVSEVAAECRKDDNSRYSQEEISSMASELEEKKLTLNFPFCFTPGALEIKRAFLEACPGLGNDVEVGVYFSREGGPPAAWHADNNHNLTIQICGHKDWLYAPGNPNATSSRGMQEPPRSRFEQLLPVPSMRPHETTCYSLHPGSVLYVPPGHWHSVIPSGGDSCSVDLRVGSVLHAKWICEAMFASLLARFSGQGPSIPELPRAVRAQDLSLGDLSEEALQQTRFLSERLPEILKKCRLPRCFPFEPEYSDGLHTGATLAYLKKTGFLVEAGMIKPNLVLGINPLVAVTPKFRDSDTLIVHLASTSNLSGVDYLRFSLLCPVGVHASVKLLCAADQTAVTISQLQDACGRGNARGELKLLLRVLLFANVLYIDEFEEAAASEPVQRRKRKRA